MLTACGDGDSSSESVTDSSSTGSSSSSVSANGSSTVRATVSASGGTAQVSYNLDDGLSKATRSKAIAGTIHWGDNTSERISGSGSISHTYTSSGTFDINIVGDNGELQRIATVTIVVPETIVEVDSGPTYGINVSSVTCKASYLKGSLYQVSVSGSLDLPSATTGTAKINMTATLGGTTFSIASVTDFIKSGGAFTNSEIQNVMGAESTVDVTVTWASPPAFVNGVTTTTVACSVTSTI